MDISKLIQCLLIFNCSLVAQECFTNDSIIALTNARLSEDIVLTLISSRAGTYAITAEGLISLKKAGVSDKVITAIIAHESLIETAETTSPSVLDSHDGGQHITDHSNHQTLNGGESESLITLRYLQTVTSKVPVSGEDLDFEVVEPVRVNSILIPRGTRTVGRVVDWHRSNIIGRGGMLAVELSDILLPGIGIVALRADHGRTIRESLGAKATVNMRIRTNWRTMPMMLIHGNEALLESGSTVTVYASISFISDSPAPRNFAHEQIDSRDFFHRRTQVRMDSPLPNPGLQQ